MTRVRPTTIASAFLMLFSGVSQVHANDDFLGHWHITSPTFDMTMMPVPLPANYHISIEKNGDAYQAWAFNGPMDVEFNGDEITIYLDWLASSDMSHVSKLVGRINNKGELEGELQHGGITQFSGRELTDGLFSGVRIASPDVDRINLSEDLPPDPIDLSGKWMPTISRLAFNKFGYALTDQGKAIQDSFHDWDSPHIRCAGYGLVTTFYFAIFLYDIEIFQTDEQVTILYGVDAARRIYMDDREYPDGKEEETYMGFSKGEWRGNTLVVKTTHLAPNFLRSGHGNPISENAHTIEHYTLDEEGYLRAEMWVIDPENYHRPPYFRVFWDKNFSQVVTTEHGCDPDAFYRQLHLGGELDEYFKRSNYRR